jgi:hypothetical protein
MVLHMSDEELEHFKKINLSEFAASRGYALDRRESSRNSAVMRHPNGDKIVIARNDASGDWMFFSVRDDRDNGTIIDFVQHLDGVSLGRVRQLLRSWTGSPRPAGLQLSIFVKDLEPVTRSRAAVIVVWERAKNCFSLPYLTSRGIGPEALMLPRFSGRVRVHGQHDNVLFAHHDKGGLCGYEIKNKGFTGFAPGGVKGLWFSQALPTDRQLVLVESGIDALSHHILHPDELWTCYMSTGGELNPQQPELLRGAMEKLPKGAVVLLAFDNDEGGEKLVSEVKAVAPAGRELRRVVPDVGKDWNEMLKNRLGLT